MLHTFRFQQHAWLPVGLEKTWQRGRWGFLCTSLACVRAVYPDVTNESYRIEDDQIHKQCQLARDQRALLDDVFGTLWETKAFRLPPVEVWFSKLKVKGIDGRAPISSVNCRIQWILECNWRSWVVPGACLSECRISTVALDCAELRHHGRRLLLSGRQWDNNSQTTTDSKF